ncbi:hypothetical protein MSG28_000982 [Choristoneura fumiferana]|uniref:Uncharacterized protein n=2 Tax=Choristoneura fumiferana TaxID=7141 RepID=A0ACC0JF84_CHOFU|nr:hypothetical protein MSG28_006505 [Choristoneura fumiferana]KAI8430827.1 hypothetical protein MSG28_000982 [Choristoneura fumiferana]
MNIAIRTTFWVVTVGGLGYALFKVVKPDEELLKKYDEGSKHTDTRRLAHKTVEILKDAQNQNSDLNKKIEDLIKK